MLPPQAQRSLQAWRRPWPLPCSARRQAAPGSRTTVQRTVCQWLGSMTCVMGPPSVVKIQWIMGGMPCTSPQGGRTIVADTPPLHDRKPSDLTESRLQRLLDELSHGVQALGTELRRAAHHFPGVMWKDPAAPPEPSRIQPSHHSKDDGDAA
jgi:hypothetical protein